MERSTLTQQCAIDPRLNDKPSSSSDALTSGMSTLKDPRGPRPDPHTDASHGNGNASVGASASSGSGKSADTPQLSRADKAKREEGLVSGLAVSSDAPDHKRLDAYSGVNAPTSEQRATTANTNFLPLNSFTHSLSQRIPARLSGPDSSASATAGNASDMPSSSQQGSKIFVGGLSWETDEISLRRYFESFGEVLDCVIMRDRHTGHPRGFGFVTFADDQVAERAASRRHDLDGRQVEAKRAVPRNEFGSGSCASGSASGVGAHAQAGHLTGAMGSSSYGGVRGTGSGVGGYGGSGYALGGGSSGGTRQHHTTRGKVFVGGLPSQCGNEEFKSYFSAYGVVVDAQVMIDHNTGNSRGFGFVTFADEATVEVVVGPGRSNTRHEILGKSVEVKRAEPKGVSSERRRHDNYAGGSVRGGGSSSIAGTADTGNSASSTAAAAYYGNYASATLAEQYGAYYNNPQWQQYYAAMGYNFNAYPQGYNPYHYYYEAAARAGYNAVRPSQDCADRDAADCDAAAASAALDASGSAPPPSANRRSSRRDERYHPYR